MAAKEKPIKKGRLADIVVERLNARISSGELKSGERLPTERSLAESMGAVSYTQLTLPTIGG